MIQSQSFVIKSRGKVKGGNASYVLDTDNGQIQWTASVTVGMFFVSKTVSKQGVYKVDPLLLKSKRLSELGDTFSVGTAVFTITSVAPGTAGVKLEVTGEQITGVGSLDTTQDTIRISELFATVTTSVAGMSITLELDAVPSPIRFIPRKSLLKKLFQHFT